MTEIEELQHDIERHMINLASAEAEIDRLREALSEISGPDPEADLDEPDEDWRVVLKLRAIARASLALRQGEHS